ncbi:MAG: hypothetical protein PHN32_05005 [Actinomycetota bacterium]|jgi:hypothetical protein|nr:hypothetical protein [Actinomycetota bacterium]
MSKRSIIIIVVVTLILVAISLTTYYRDPEIKNIYLSELKTKPMPSTIEPLFYASSTSDIYLIIEAENLKTQHTLAVDWEKENQDGYSLVQHDTITPQTEGSGTITISMIKRDGSLQPGKYKVSVTLADQVVVAYFKIE